MPLVDRLGNRVFPSEVRTIAPQSKTCFALKDPIGDFGPKAIAGREHGKRPDQSVLQIGQELNTVAVDRFAPLGVCLAFRVIEGRTVELLAEDLHPFKEFGGQTLPNATISTGRGPSRGELFKSTRLEAGVTSWPPKKLVTNGSEQQALAIASQVAQTALQSNCSNASIRTLWSASD